MNDIPEEISVNPVPYISLLGLDAANNPVHTKIWNSLAINRSTDRPVLYYKLLSSNHRFPQSKNRTSYDRYIPTGIIKTKWLNKHLFEIPSVVVLFESLPNWQQLDRKRISNEISQLKTLLSTRQIKIVVILLQSEPIPITYNQEIDSSQYKDNAARFCDECDINPKSLFIIPIQDEQSIPAYVIRVELALNELAKSHYQQKAKQIKSYRDQLNKSAQIYLFIRHEFKLGFYHEIRQIYNQALIHYKNSYATLMEIRIHSIENLFEIKNIATILNYKILRLSFYLNTPLDAISYFRKHIDIFQNRFASDKRLEFEHYEWLAKQFFLFGELFDMLIAMLHLTPTSLQNPGNYYFESALYTIKRREALKQQQIQLTNDEIEYVGKLINNYNNDSSDNYIGQYKWLNSDNRNIIDYFKIFFYIEQKANLTDFLIKLYMNVLSHIKKFKKPRFMRFVMYLIGKEYYQQKNYNDSLNYFINIIHFYRNEQWILLHRCIVEIAIQSAYLSIDYINFIKFSFEYLSNDTIHMERKCLLMETLKNFLQLRFHPFIFHENSNNEDLHGIENEWQNKLNVIQENGLPSVINNQNNEIIINVDHETNFLKCKIKFRNSYYTIADDIRIDLAIYNQLDENFESIDLRIKFENPDNDSQCKLLSSSEQLSLNANSLNLFEFSLRLINRPSFDDNNRQFYEIKISEILLTLKSKISLRFQWIYATTAMVMPILPLKSTTNDALQFNKFDVRTKAEIHEPESRLQLIDLKIKPQIFRNENAMILMHLKSNESYSIQNLKLIPKILHNQQMAIAATEANLKAMINDYQFWFVTEPNNETILLGSDGMKIIEQLESNNEVNIKLIFLSQSIGMKNILFEFIYDLIILSNDQAQQPQQTITVGKKFIKSINVIEPFEFIAKLSNLANPDTSNIRLDEPFRLNCYLRVPMKNENDNINRLDSGEINNISYNHFPDDSIEIEKIESNFNENIKIISQKTSQLPISLSLISSMATNEIQAPIDSYLMTCSKFDTQLQQSMGSWTVRWHRKSLSSNDDNNQMIMSSTTIYSLPSITIKTSIIYVELLIPEKLYARNPFMAKYRLHSRLDNDVNIDVQIMQAEYFMIAGNRQVKILLPSRSIIEQVFIFFPLTCGQLQLPKLELMLYPIATMNLLNMQIIQPQNQQQPQQYQQQTITHPMKIDYLDQMIVSNVFVLPKLRTNINL